MNKWFNFGHLRGDLLGGITAGVVALPLALAFGASSGLGAAYGLYGAIFIGFFAALFGGTQTQISGPTAPMTAVSMVIIAAIAASIGGTPQEAIPLIMAVFLLAGLIQILMGFMGLGSFIKYIPYPVVSGFMTAIGVLILFGESFNMLGYYPENDPSFVEQFSPQAEEKLLEEILKDEARNGVLAVESYKETINRSNEVNEQSILKKSVVLAKKDTSGVLGKIKNFPRAIKNIKFYELLLVGITILIIYGFKRITTKVPSTLVALIFVTILALLLKNQMGHEYVKISEIPNGFPIPIIGEIFSNLTFSGLAPYIGAAISLAFLGAIDSLLTSVVADNLTKTKHKSNQELIGQGIGNSIAAIFKGLPGSGATIRTVVNINAGGKTRLSGMIAAVLLLIISLFVSDAASQIPKAVLSGILITVGFGVMDFKGLKAIPSMAKDIRFNLFGLKLNISSEVIIMFSVLLIAVVFDLILAVGIGLIIAALIFMKKMGDITARQSKSNSLKEQDSDLWEDEMNFPNKMKDEVYIKHLDGPLFFGYVSDFHDLILSLPEKTTHVIFRMDKITYVDHSGLYAFEEILIDFMKNHKKVLLVGTPENILLRLRSFDIVPDLISEEMIFTDFDSALSWLKNNIDYK